MSLLHNVSIMSSQYIANQQSYHSIYYIINPTFQLFLYAKYINAFTIMVVDHYRARYLIK